jgi:hypothetical protein
LRRASSRYELLALELRPLVPDERELVEREVERDPDERDAERDPDERDPDERDPDERDPDERDVERDPEERVVLLRAVLAGFLSAPILARSLSNSLRASRLAFLASRCKLFSALPVSLYASWALLLTLWLTCLPAACSAPPASSRSFSRRCCARCKSRRVLVDLDAVADEDVRLVERAVDFRAAVVLRAAGFLAGGMTPPC